MKPEVAMARALACARRGAGRCFPNPSVGAVLLRGERILGSGTTQPAGGPHAEVVALQSAVRRHGARAVRGATLVVTLEPCAHKGRTAPCCDAIIEAGIARVIAGVRDPHPHTSGRGFRRLRSKGVTVQKGVLEAECREQHRGFFSVVQRGRPWVALKLAATLDGRIATAAGESRWITGRPARALVHRLRDRHDALMIGSGAARADDPALTVRRPGHSERTPVRVLVDARLRVSPSARLFRDAGAAQTWCLCATGHGPRKRSAREARGARLLAQNARRDGHLDLRFALRRLAREGLTSVLVEGGGGLAAALLRLGLVDELHWFSAPALLGGDAHAALGALGLRRLSARVRFRPRVVRRVGADLYLHAVLGSGGSR